MGGLFWGKKSLLWTEVGWNCSELCQQNILDDVLKTTPFEVKSVSQTQVDGGNGAETEEKKRDEKSLKKLDYRSLIFFSFFVDTT